MAAKRSTANQRESIDDILDTLCTLYLHAPELPLVLFETAPAAGVVASHAFPLGQAYFSAGIRHHFSRDISDFCLYDTLSKYDHRVAAWVFTKIVVPDPANFPATLDNDLFLDVRIP
jgi:hypothetical protein